MNRKWRVVWMLLIMTWWGATPALAEKVKHFKDDKGTLHITNVKPDEPGKTPEAPGAAGEPLKVRLPESSSSSPGGAFPPPAPEPAAEVPEEVAEAPEPPPEEPPEAQAEIQPEEEGG
jgi:hypothetical protein